MAYLTEEPYEMPTIGNIDEYEDYDEYERDQRDALKELTDPIVKFPVADGYAIYRVVDFEYEEPCDHCGSSGEPLLQHIPFGDAYQASGSTINGLTTEGARKRAEELEL